MFSRNSGIARRASRSSPSIARGRRPCDTGVLDALGHDPADIDALSGRSRPRRGCRERRAGRTGARRPGRPLPGGLYQRVALTDMRPTSADASLPHPAALLIICPPFCPITLPAAMAKSLIIAEKPSVAADIARALGGFTSHDDYFESERLRLVVGRRPPARDRRPRKSRSSAASGPSRTCRSSRRTSTWSRSRRAEARLKLLLKLVKRKDVTALINACDAGREGELIFRHIAQYAKTKKPIKRLWLQSMTRAAIRDGFDAPAQRRGDAAAGRRGGLPLRGRLAGRHQRHARDDRVQLQDRAASS